MDAFENLIAMLLRRDGYWTATSVKVELTKEEKRKINRPSSPRWEIDVVAYKGSTNELLAVECKSFLDSPGVKFRNGQFEPIKTYKLFCDQELRDTILSRLKRQLIEKGACPNSPSVKLCMAVGHIASVTDRRGLSTLFKSHGWSLFDDAWILEKLREAATTSFENDIAHVVAKLIVRNREHTLT
jgi:hypothetical protein